MKPKPRRLLARISPGEVANVSFADMRQLIEAFGFELMRTNGSHHVFGRPDIRELINVQDANGQEVRQFLRLVDRYALSLEDEQ